MRWAIVLLVLGALGGVLWWTTRSGPEPVPSDRITEPRIGSIVRGVIAVGRVEPRTRVDVKSKANGIIMKLHVDVSDTVRAGDVLVELDKEILEARLEEAEARLQQARGSVETAKANVARIGVEKKDPELDFAARNWERAKRLFEDKIVSEDERDQAKDRHEKARHRIEVLDSQLSVAQAEVTVAEGKLKEFQAQAELARQELLEATIVSPIDGVVLHRYLEEGDSVSSIRVAGGNATIIMTLGDLSELYVDGEVDEVDVGKIIAEQKIRPDLAARVTIESFRERTFSGRVARIAPLGLEDSNGIITFEVRITLENPERLLLANMTAISQIVLEEKKDVLLLSQGALVTEKGARYAYLVDPATGQRRRQEVQTGISDGSLVEISSGLKPGQKVLIP
jgi:HlyD family secretion protein